MFRTLINKIFYLGLLRSQISSDERKRILITNKIALIMAVSTVFIFLIDLGYNFMFDKNISWVNISRTLLVSFILFFALFLNYWQYYTIAKMTIILLPLFVLNYIPVVTNKITAESYLINPIITIAVSFFIHLLFYIKTEKLAYWICIVTSFGVLVATDYVYNYFSEDRTGIYRYIEQFQFTYMLVKASVFIFINAVLLYVWQINFSIQTDLENVKEEMLEKNTLITIKNKQLEEIKEELLVQNTELHAQNEEIISQRDYIDEQHNQIKIQNRDIVKSIEYAKRIQEAMLPKENPIAKYTSANFVIFEPKEIISGDFYWSKKVDDIVIVVAADCTGHGVPGAFLSMLGISILNEIVGTLKVTNTSYILNLMRQKVVDSLSQKTNKYETKDGMDICICAFNFHTNTIQYSGAYNPLIVIKQNRELIELEADRMPVGIHDRFIEPFTSKKISFEKGDKFYLFSDGYQDQFGGAKNKKFMKKRFKQLLFESSTFSMQNQKKILVGFFEEWKGVNVQVDDVLVLGIEI